MTRASLLAATAVLLIPLMAGAGCVKMPTEQQQVVDTRPGISFRALNRQAAAARVYIDDLDVGAARDYAEGRAAVRVQPGTHVLRVVAKGDRVLLQEKVYLGEGVNRVFIVK